MSKYNKNLSICHVITSFEAGGAQTFLVSLTKAQQQFSKKIFVISLDKIENTQFNNSLIDNLKLNGINVFSFNRKPGKNLSILKSFYNARVFFKKYDFDVINTHLPLSHLFISLLHLRIKVVNTIHNAPEKTSFLTRFLNKSFPKIYCSQSAKDLNSFYGKNKVINNGVVFNKNEHFNKLNIYDELNIPPNSKLVISVGALRPQKNYIFLMDLVKNHFDNSNIHFLVLGNIVQKIKTHKEILKHNLNNLHYLGVKSNVNDYLYSCDLFLSCALFEGLPIAVLEAVFQGMPCVLSPIKPHIEIFDNLNGVYIPSTFDKLSFKNEIINVFKQEYSKSKLIEDREVFINKYKIESTAIEYVNFYEEI